MHIDEDARAASRWNPVRNVALFIIAGLASGVAHAGTLDAATQARIRAATFEVVVPKPVADPIIYEKPLPLELLPYQERTDKYHSIGTAFAIGGNRYLTAGHVLGVTVGGLNDAPALRGTDGNIYAIGQIEKFSGHEDFVVFTLATPPAKATALEIGSVALNEPVYSVGNALGEGVVIRDGLYTSDTPEEQDGRWKWMRFSAAASPGNSGGPLLDKDGKVVGIVLMKSPNENLNYALPIERVMKAPDHLARFDSRGQYKLDIFDNVKSLQLKKDFALPKNFADFSAAYMKVYDEFNEHGLRELLAENSADMFPRGTGSSRLLQTLYEKTFPGLIVRGADGIWSIDTPRATRADLGNSGAVDYGHVKEEVLLHMHKPGNVDPEKLYSDPLVYVQLELKGMPLYRHVGSEKIRITSFRKPSEDSKFTDSWGRVWQLRVWPAPHLNALLISLDLPVPDGYVSITRTVFAATRKKHIADMKVLADFVIVSYRNTLDRWARFMQMKELLPKMLSPSMLKYEFGRNFEYQSSRISFSYTQELLKISDETRLTLDFGFVAAGNKTILDVVGVAIHEDYDDKNEIGVFRYRRPAADLDATYQKMWSKRLHGEHPFDAIAFDENGMRYIRAVGATAATPPPDVLYGFLYRCETGGQDKMKAKIDLLMTNAQIKER